MTYQSHPASPGRLPAPPPYEPKHRREGGYHPKDYRADPWSRARCVFGAHPCPLCHPRSYAQLSARHRRY